MKALILCDECHPAEAAALAAQWDCGIEVQAFYDPTYYENTPDAIASHAAAIPAEYRIALHGPFCDLCPGSSDPLVRKLARVRYEEGAAFASALGINHLILHHGYIPGTSFRDNWIKRCVVFWTEFLADKPESFRLHLENVFEKDIAMLSELLAAIGDSRVDVNLDVGHVHGFARMNVVEWIEKLGTLIGYVHLHDNSGETDEHLPIGAGTVLFDDVCAALNQYCPDAYWALESKWGTKEQSYAWLAERGWVG